MLTWCRTLYIPAGDRSDWNDLLTCTKKLLTEALAERGQHAAVVVGESFGGCLGLRVAAAVPHLVSHLILVNPATSFSRSFAGIPSLIAGTNLLSIFPEPLYQVSGPAPFHSLANCDCQGLLPIFPSMSSKLKLCCLHVPRGGGGGGGGGGGSLPNGGQPTKMRPYQKKGMGLQRRGT